MANQTAIIGGIVVVIIVIAAIVLYSGNGSAVTYQTTTIQPTPTTTVMPTGSNGTASGGSANSTSTNSTGLTNSTSTTGSKNTTSVTSVTETFNVVENDFTITPSAITVLSGDTVVFNVTNAGHQTHNLMFVSGVTGGIPSLRAGQVQLFTFTAPAPGVYTYQSNFGSDASYNMSGTLTVK